GPEAGQGGPPGRALAVRSRVAGPRRMEARPALLVRGLLRRRRAASGLRDRQVVAACLAALVPAGSPEVALVGRPGQRRPARGTGGGPGAALPARRPGVAAQGGGLVD